MCKRKVIVCLCLCCLLMTLCGCGEKEHVTLTVWGSESSQDMLRQMADDFIEQNKDKADIEIVLGVEEEDTLAENVVGSPERAADVFSFPDDQILRLMDAGALLEITENADAVIADNGGAESSAIQCAMPAGDNKLYAYPMTASNGYFMYYNAAYFTEEDVKTLDRMLEVAEQNGKYLAMDWTSGWYMYSFFKGAGLSLGLSEDGQANVCNWNAVDTEYKGVDVAQAMLDISAKKGFMDANDDAFKNGVEAGTVIAGVNGLWNASFVESIWGENYRAVKLPTYTINGTQLQMGSFAGYKLVGVNANTKSPEWAMRFAGWITNYDSQLTRFHVTGELPSNKQAAASPEVQASPAIKAFMNQAPFSAQQRVSENFWKPATLFGTVMSSGNLDKRDLQELLDELVRDVEAPVK